MELVRKPWGVLALGIALCGVAAAPAAAQTLEAALVQAYLNNPSLNSQRAAVRATDENVAQALAGYRPRASINGTGGEVTSSTTTKNASASPGGSSMSARRSPSPTCRAHSNACLRRRRAASGRCRWT